MKTALSTLAAALALAFGAAAFAAPGDNAPAATQWDQSQEHLVRQFSQGFGFAIDEAHPFLVARVQLRHVKLPEHSR
ncbi:MAG: hypothetical protein EPO20_12500 [Betaproteobacteria bacterium]|nr:MAG: hypothetical protein EPO20_12500 [Betaproteobacteria bacterium]